MRITISTIKEFIIYAAKDISSAILSIIYPSLYIITECIGTHLALSLIDYILNLSQLAPILKLILAHTTWIPISFLALLLPMTSTILLTQYACHHKSMKNTVLYKTLSYLNNEGLLNQISKISLLGLVIINAFIILVIYIITPPIAILLSSTAVVTSMLLTYMLGTLPTQQSSITKSLLFLATAASYGYLATSLAGLSVTIPLFIAAGFQYIPNITAFVAGLVLTYGVQYYTQLSILRRFEKTVIFRTIYNIHMAIHRHYQHFKALFSIAWTNHIEPFSWYFRTETSLPRLHMQTTNAYIQLCENAPLLVQNSISEEHYNCSNVLQACFENPKAMQVYMDNELTHPATNHTISYIFNTPPQTSLILPLKLYFLYTPYNFNVWLEQSTVTAITPRMRQTAIANYIEHFNIRLDNWHTHPFIATLLMQGYFDVIVPLLKVNTSSLNNLLKIITPHNTKELPQEIKDNICSYLVPMSIVTLFSTTFQTQGERLQHTGQYPYYIERSAIHRAPPHIIQTLSDENRHKLIRHVSLPENRI